MPTEDDLAEMLAAQAGQPSECGLCQLMEQMTPEHLEALERGLGDRRVNTTGILAWLAKRGYVMDRKAPNKVVSNHRQRHRA